MRESERGQRNAAHGWRQTNRGESKKMIRTRGSATAETEKYMRNSQFEAIRSSRTAAPREKEPKDKL